MSHLIVCLSDRGPVDVGEEANWRVIATAATSVAGGACITVREHTDGSRLVYGTAYVDGASSQRSASAGFHLDRPGAFDDANAETVRAIRRVAGVLLHPHLGQRAIEGLPAVQL